MITTFLGVHSTKWGVETRVGHAYAEYAEYADYAIMRNLRMRMKMSSTLSTYKLFSKNGNILGQKWVSLALFSIQSAHNIIIFHPTWFYTSSGMKNMNPESQYFGQKKLIFFTI